MKFRALFPMAVMILVLVTVIVIVSVKTESENSPFQVSESEAISVLGVCPPFYLLTQEGDTINPLSGANIDKPYSPKQTCGKCHDYEKITEGFHFQQGKDEAPLDILVERMQWISSPGNYGGPWCSPAPLYRYLSEKNNYEEAMIDMTSFEFVVSCGVCHPGGGSIEYDRNGLRYDSVMNDPVNHFVSGGTNNLDGDYFKAKWGESGVIEADCYICHLPGYDNKERVRNIQNMNFKWAATAASGLAVVNGSIASNDPVSLTYNKSLFNPNGMVEPNIVREPRNEACLFCHAKPGWKKRGANFHSRTDVHLQAGLKCVDCHPAGKSATHDLISGKEVHQFGKGDDPGGHVRDDLDNTMRTCTDCHDNGYLGAPLAKHKWLPPLHLDKIACQTCHIPERTVKSAHFVASDIFNPGAKIPTKGKHLWTFYDPAMNYWNHYGDLEMMGYDDKPTYTFSPELVKYKGVIYPANRVHTAWPAIQTEGKSGLMQPKMGDIYKMWADHRQDPEKYHGLSAIRDNNADEVIEINTPEEIDALIRAVSMKLKEINYPMENKMVVWVMNNRIYSSGTEYTELSKDSWEASPYGNVHTYNHDIFPANSALGANGCTECHSYQSGFFTSPVLKTPFDEEGKPVTQPQFTTLGFSAVQVHTGILRETFLKPIIYVMVILLVVLLLVSGLRRILKDQLSVKWLNGAGLVVVLGALVVFGRILIDNNLSRYMLPSRLQLDANHFIIGLLIILAGAVLLFFRLQSEGITFSNNPVIKRTIHRYMIAVLIITCIAGLGMLVISHWVVYSLFDLGLVLTLTGSILMLFETAFPKQIIENK
ncbi:MAG: hypothetical protein ISS19_08510 [Bacteroidales bacterium]|nr:hypothetical protein [Bacteroidales bacterium]